MVAYPFANPNQPPLLEKPAKWNLRRGILVEDLRCPTLRRKSLFLVQDAAQRTKNHREVRVFY
jgi:hypothetical protein